MHSIHNSLGQCIIDLDPRLCNLLIVIKLPFPSQKYGIRDHS